MTTVLVNLTWLVPGVVGGSEESTTAALRSLAGVLDAYPAAELPGLIGDLGGHDLGDMLAALDLDELA